jgi:hypothetical protein
MSVEQRNKERRFVTARRIGVATVVTVLVSTGLAYGFWTVTGNGQADDKAVTAQTLTITAAASPTADLFPGGTGALQFTVTNPNPFGVSLTSLSTTTVTSSDPTNCPAANVTAAAGPTSITAIAVAAHATSPVQSVPGVVSMVTAAPNGCQGVTFTVTATLSGSST